MDGVDIKNSLFIRLAKTKLQQLCSDEPSQSIESIHSHIDAERALSRLTDSDKRLYHEMVDWAALFCDDFEYQSQGELEHGSFLHLVCRLGLAHLVQEILRKLDNEDDLATKGKVVNIKSRRFGRTPLHEAVASSCDPLLRRSAVESLLQSQVCEVFEVDSQGATPLQLALSNTALTADEPVPDATVDSGVLALPTEITALLNAAAERGQAVYTSFIQSKEAERQFVEYYTSTMSMDIDLPNASLRRTESMNKCMAVVKTETTRKLLPLIAREKLKIPNGTLNLAFEAAINAEDLHLAMEVLTFMHDNNRTFGYSGMLTSGHVKAGLILAVERKELRLVNMIYRLSSWSHINREIDEETTQSVLRLACTSGSVDIVTSICTKNPVGLASADASTLAAGLQKAISCGGSDLLSILCTHCNVNVLSSVGTAILECTLRYACKHRLADVLETLRVAELHLQNPSPSLQTKVFRRRKLVEGRVSEETLEAIVDFLRNELLSLEFSKKLDRNVWAQGSGGSMLKQYLQRNCGRVDFSRRWRRSTPDQQFLQGRYLGQG